MNKLSLDDVRVVVKRSDGLAGVHKTRYATKEDLLLLLRDLGAEKLEQNRGWVWVGQGEQSHYWVIDAAVFEGEG